MPSTAEVGFTGTAHHLELYPEAIKKAGQALVSRGEAQGLPLALPAQRTHPPVTERDCPPSPFSAPCHPLEHSPHARPVSKVQQGSVLSTFCCIQNIHKDAVTTYNIKNTHPYIGQQSKETQSKCGLYNCQTLWMHGKLLGKDLTVLKTFSCKELQLNAL